MAGDHWGDEIPVDQSIEQAAADSSTRFCSPAVS
jgi:hypothetical protein